MVTFRAVFIWSSLYVLCFPLISQAISFTFPDDTRMHSTTGINHHTQRSTSGGLLKSSEGSASLDTRIVQNIEIEGNRRIDTEELRDLLYTETGRPLDAYALALGIRRAFKKGIFNDIQVQTEPFDDGITLIYLVREIPVINNMKMKGNRYISKKKIRNVFPFEEGGDFRRDKLDHAIDQIREFYDRKGFRNAAASVHIDDSKIPGLLNITLQIEEGDPDIVMSIDVPEEVRNLMRMRESDIFDRDVIEKDLIKIRKYYERKHYVRPIIGPYEFTSGKLKIPVVKGPRLIFSFINNKAIKSKNLTRAVAFMRDEAVTDESIEEAVNRLENMYMNYGYYRAKIIAAIEKGDNIHISFLINEGDSVIVRDITFEGVSISHEILLNMLSLKTGENYSEDYFNRDRETLQNFYNSLGYLHMDMEVKKTFLTDRELHVNYIIREGEQILIASVKISGAEAVSAAHIEDAIGQLRGNPYNIIDVGNARYKLLSLYRQSGYADALVNLKTTIEEGSAHLVFSVTEKNQYVVGKVILAGNRKTKPKIIRRELTFGGDDIFSYDELLRVKQRLYQLGIFNEVSIDSIDTGIMLNGKPVRDILLSLEESKAGSVEFSIGYGDYERARGMFNINYRNLGGYNRTIGFKTEMSDVEERFVFSFREPWLFNRPDINLNVYLFRDDSRSINLDTREILYKIDKFGLLAGAEKTITDTLKFNLDYEYSFTDTKDVKEGVILSKEDTGTLAISSISPSLHYDIRDNPFDPASGSLHSIVVKFASDAILSEIGFIKTTFKSSWFSSLHKRIILALSFGGGIAFSFEDTKELPLIERYFLGGRTTVRGYENDTLGPKGKDGSPTGGNIYALLNGEFRFSLGRGIGLVTFVDGGNVWKDSSDINQDLKYTMGAGLRYKTPVGPLRIDYGHKLSRKTEESAGEVHFSFGHAF